jgi:hypothetical protein
MYDQSSDLISDDRCYWDIGSEIIVVTCVILYSMSVGTPSFSVVYIERCYIIMLNSVLEIILFIVCDFPLFLGCLFHVG